MIVLGSQGLSQCLIDTYWMIISIDFEGFPATELMPEESHVFRYGFGQTKSILSL